MESAGLAVTGRRGQQDHGRAVAGGAARDDPLAPDQRLVIEVRTAAEIAGQAALGRDRRLLAPEFINDSSPRPEAIGRRSYALGRAASGRRRW